MNRLRWSKGHGPESRSLCLGEVRRFVDYRLRYGSASTESHVPRGLRQSRRELTPVLCFVRLSWRHRARPSTTLHEIRPAEAGRMLNCYHRTPGFANLVCAERRWSQAIADSSSILTDRICRRETTFEPKPLRCTTLPLRRRLWCWIASRGCTAALWRCARFR